MNKIRNNKNRQIKYFPNRKYRSLKEITTSRYNILIGIITFMILLIFVNLFFLQIIQKEYYVERVNTITKNIIEGSTAPRGRIYDRNHEIIVDNKPVKVIYYKKTSGVTTKEEIELAYKVANMIDVDFRLLTKSDLKNFWLKNNPNEGRLKINDIEWKMLEERRLTLDEIEKLKLERITEEELNVYNDLDKEAAYIYVLMNRGYYNSEKVIKNQDVTDAEYAIISENIHTLKGFNTKLEWERYYPYGNVFRSILGNVSSSEAGIPYELKDHYLELGYSLNDRVGVSYLEYQYENYLRGKKDKYEVLSNGEYKLIEEGRRGNDIVLSIDIKLQQEVERVLIEQLINAKKEPNTEYYNRSFVIITDALTGEILAMSGKQIIEKEDGEYTIYDYSPGITTSPVVVGSTVKGASHIVGYNNGALKIGEVRNDACIKIINTPQKCSWKYLGNIDDITALKQSSNTYQFLTAIKLGKGKYEYNKPLNLDTKAFDTFRDTFAEFGLGVRTEIDLPIESLGYKGTSRLPGHLLDFSIGQYDSYTPIQLSQYIGTIASGGNRMKMNLLKSVHVPEVGKLGRAIYTNTPTVLNKVNTKDEYLQRVQEGFKEVLKPGGTGNGYMPYHVNPAGKTGTSQSFIDTDGNGIVDTETLTNTFVGYAPFKDTKITFTVVSPDISHYGNKTRYQTSVNKKITLEVSKKFFEIYQ